MSRLLLEGTVLPTQHTIERYLGEGAFAEVYRVRHRVFGRQAMKVFKQPVQPGQDVTRTLSEAILLSKIGHPNIVRVFDAGTFDLDGEEYGFLTMEYAGGGTLYDLWRGQGMKTMPVSTAVDLVRQTTAGLALAHRHQPPIIHRDIKPNNILVSISGDGYLAKVSDFGLAREVNPLTLMATAAGTLSFKAPEVFVTDKSDSPAGDIWSLGVTLYLLLTDQMPFNVEENAIPTRSVYQKPFPLPSRLNCDCDESLDAIIKRALALDPAQRYPDAVSFVAMLAAWRPNHSPYTPPVNSPSTSSQSLRAIQPAIATADKQLATDWVKRAYDHARQGKLAKAADLLEEALQADPQLRATHESRVRLWRMGVAM
jgi:serine/threonine protein kinase